MKIRKGLASEQQLRELRQRNDQQLIDQTASAISRKRRGDEDEVNVSLGRYIQSELSVEQLAEERRAKVEELKEKIQSGNYAPSSEAVAEALGREIISDIAFASQSDDI